MALQDSKSPVAVVMGSDSDLNTMNNCIDQLKEFGITPIVRIISAHRTPDAAAQFADNAAANGIKIIIAAAGMAAHLAGSHRRTPRRRRRPQRHGCPPLNRPDASRRPGCLDGHRQSRRKKRRHLRRPDPRPIRPQTKRKTPNLPRRPVKKGNRKRPVPPIHK